MHGPLESMEDAAELGLGGHAADLRRRTDAEILGSGQPSRCRVACRCVLQRVGRTAAMAMS